MKPIVAGIVIVYAMCFLCATEAAEMDKTLVNVALGLGENPVMLAAATEKDVPAPAPPLACRDRW